MVVNVLPNQAEAVRDALGLRPVNQMLPRALPGQNVDMVGFGVPGSKQAKELIFATLSSCSIRHVVTPH